MLTRKYNNAFSLVELLIALVLGLLLLSMVISLYITVISTGTKGLKASRLRADLQSILAMIETDIRRAGYGGEAYLVGIDGTKPIDINNNQDCIVYYYNHDNSVALESSNKMALSLKEGSVKFTTNVGPIAADSCAYTSGWIDISDNQFVTITTLTFSENSISNAVSTMRSVDITLAGELVSDSSYNHSITSHVQIRNIYYND